MPSLRTSLNPESAQNTFNQYLPPTVSTPHDCTYNYDASWTHTHILSDTVSQVNCPCCISLSGIVSIILASLIFTFGFSFWCLIQMSKSVNGINGLFNWSLQADAFHVFVDVCRIFFQWFWFYTLYNLCFKWEMQYRCKKIQISAFKISFLLSFVICLCFEALLSDEIGQLFLSQNTENKLHEKPCNYEWLFCGNFCFATLFRYVVSPILFGYLTLFILSQSVDIDYKFTKSLLNDNNDNNNNNNQIQASASATSMGRGGNQTLQLKQNFDQLQQQQQHQPSQPYNLPHNNINGDNNNLITHLENDKLQFGLWNNRNNNSNKNNNNKLLLYGNNVETSFATFSQFSTTPLQTRKHASLYGQDRPKELRIKYLLWSLLWFIFLDLIYFINDFVSNIPTKYLSEHEMSFQYAFLFLLSSNTILKITIKNIATNIDPIRIQLIESQNDTWFSHNDVNININNNNNKIKNSHNSQSNQIDETLINTSLQIEYESSTEDRLYKLSSQATHNNCKVSSTLAIGNSNGNYNHNNNSKRKNKKKNQKKKKKNSKTVTKSVKTARKNGIKKLMSIQLYSEIFSSAAYYYSYKFIVFSELSQLTINQLLYSLCLHCLWQFCQSFRYSNIYFKFSIKMIQFYDKCFDKVCNYCTCCGCYCYCCGNDESDHDCKIVEWIKWQIGTNDNCSLYEWKVRGAIDSTASFIIAIVSGITVCLYCLISHRYQNTSYAVLLSFISLLSDILYFTIYSWFEWHFSSFDLFKPLVAVYREKLGLSLCIIMSLTCSLMAYTIL